jgi:hypothetical protein
VVRRTALSPPMMDRIRLRRVPGNGYGARIQALWVVNGAGRPAPPRSQPWIWLSF